MAHFWAISSNFEFFPYLILNTFTNTLRFNLHMTTHGFDLNKCYGGSLTSLTSICNKRTQIHFLGGGYMFSDASSLSKRHIPVPFYTDPHWRSQGGWGALKNLLMLNYPKGVYPAPRNDLCVAEDESHFPPIIKQKLGHILKII